MFTLHIYLPPLPFTVNLSFRQSSGPCLPIYIQSHLISIRYTSIVELFPLLQALQTYQDCTEDLLTVLVVDATCAAEKAFAVQFSAHNLMLTTSPLPLWCLTFLRKRSGFQRPILVYILHNYRISMGSSKGLGQSLMSSIHSENPTALERQRQNQISPSC